MLWLMVLRLRIGSTKFMALLANGTQNDPMSYAEACPEVSRTVGELDMRYLRYHVWDDLVAYHCAQFDPLNEGELRTAFTDERIRAVLPMAPCYGPIYGERGLAVARVPTLIVGLSHAVYYTYERDDHDGGH